MVLAIVMLVAVLLLISLSASLPSVYQDGRREREAELVFRGTQYARAVALFHKQFNRYPVSVKELMGTNGMRFLRQEYADPMDPKGQWRFIHVNAAGVLLDSKNQPLQNNNGNPAGIGTSNNSAFGGGSSFGGSSSSAFGGSSFGGSSFGGSSFGGTSSIGTSSGFQLGSTQSDTGTNSSQIGPTSSFFGNQNQIQGAFIAGVAATSHHESIRIWQKHHHYDEWEFIGLDMGVFGIQVGTGTSAAPGMSQPNPGNGFSPGGFGNNNSSSPGGFGNTNPSSTFGPSSN